MTVTDVTAPTVVTRNISVTLVNGLASITAAQIDGGSTDNCGIDSRQLSRTTFNCTSLGANSVTLTATDARGNSANATAVVTVVGSIPTPTIAVTLSNNVYTGGVANTLYLGYGPQSATLTASGGMSYVWSPATGLSSATIANPVFTATAAGSYTYTVMATNGFGCTATAMITLRVVEARCGNKNDKVLVCHNGHEICISPNAVPAHMGNHADDYLGSCTGRGARNDDAAPLASQPKTALLFEAFPNPFSASTTVHLRPAATAPAKVLVYDGLGRVVATLYNGIAEAGHDYALTFNGGSLATGLYLCRYESQGRVYTQRLSVVK